MLESDGKIYQELDIDDWKNIERHPRSTRALRLHESLAKAVNEGLPIKVVILKGSGNNPSGQSGSVVARGLDTKTWAVVESDIDRKFYKLVRGAAPVQLIQGEPQSEIQGFEGSASYRLVKHRLREQQLREIKIKEHQFANDGRLICEVPRCGFDFHARYGVLGEGYAHVHHLSPLSSAPDEGRSVVLSDLAIVCANCHAMIHRGGECRDMKELISEEA